MAPVRLVIDGHPIEGEPGTSLFQAWVAAGLPLTENVGCMGQGVCGACRVLVRRPGQRLAQTGLACETLLEDGMQVAFINLSRRSRPHPYDLHALGDSWDAIGRIDELFPEAKRCRHCGGCDSACPKGIEVQQMVNLAAVGQTYAAAELCDDCVQCNLCVAACPERIDPAHLGQLIRRMTAAMTLRPSDLIMRLHEIEAGEQPIDVDAPGALPPPVATDDEPAQHAEDDGGNFPLSRLNEWERKVVLAEVAKPATVAWYRNPPRSAGDSLCIAYRNEFGNWRGMYPDFLFFERVEGRVRPSILDPHRFDLDDALTKLRALAAFAERFGDRFHRIESLAEVSGRMRRLNLKSDWVRDDVKYCNGDLAALYLGRGSVESAEAAVGHNRTRSVAARPAALFEDS